jgi:CDP-glucose 4,6-dehydratase
MQANQRPTETLDVNVRGTWALLEAVRSNTKHVRATIFASSDKAYGNLQGERYDESYPLAGSHPYDVSKSAADLICQAYAHSYRMNVCITRCGNFFGPGDLNENRIFPSTILANLRKEAPVIRSDGKYIRDYIYVADGASAYRTLARAMLSKDIAGHAFNFSYGLRLTVLDVVEAVSKAMGEARAPVILNQASNEIPVQCLDSAKAREWLGWKPEFGFESGVAATVGWYREQFAKGVLR